MDSEVVALRAECARLRDMVSQAQSDRLGVQAGLERCGQREARLREALDGLRESRQRMMLTEEHLLAECARLREALEGLVAWGEINWRAAGPHAAGLVRAARAALAGKGGVA